MQKDFINIASREEMIQAIQRNAIRLQKLTSDILDVTRIESQTLNLNKEQFNLTDLVLSIIEDYRSRIENDSNRNVKLLYNRPKEDIIAEADKEEYHKLFLIYLVMRLNLQKKKLFLLTQKRKIVKYLLA
jgi:signal transduction histidine kinase